ncbi:hypothetical protein M9H77_12363 [Catharanthus roseus]|uniref:Uncharacterized protein n=1 Tax=Catharanthus roseus TaxID=4058 RepID=A0ACC0BH73_CATRO|nr:hypothetical protein M9H77_12363 [Catharanthus roseus]
MGMACFGFGAFHVMGLCGKVQPVNPAWGIKGFDSFVPGRIASHHIVVGTFGNNPVKGGLLRAGSIDNKDGIGVGWLRHPIFRDKEGHGDGIVRADVPFSKGKIKSTLKSDGLVQSSILNLAFFVMIRTKRRVHPRNFILKVKAEVRRSPRAMDTSSITRVDPRTSTVL